MPRRAHTVRGVFPAPAGMSRALMLLYQILCGFPRTCGDEPAIDRVAEENERFSPHLRG